MSRPNWLLMAVGIFIVGTLLMCITSGRWLTNGETNIINALGNMGYKQFGDFVAPTNLITWFNAAITAISWNYPGTWLDETANGWIIFVKIPLWLCSLAVIWLLIDIGRVLIQGALSMLKGLISPS